MKPGKRVFDDSASHPWSAWAATHGRLVWLRILRHGVAPERAKELAQEVWEGLFRRWREGELQEISMPGLALRQADFLALSERRKRHDLVCAPDEEVAIATLADAEEQVAQRARLSRVISLIRKCSPSAQRVFVLRYCPPGLSTQEIADELSLSEQRVRQIICELRQFIREAE